MKTKFSLLTHFVFLLTIHLALSFYIFAWFLGFNVLDSLYVISGQIMRYFIISMTVSWFCLFGVGLMLIAIWSFDFSERDGFHDFKEKIEKFIKSGPKVNIKSLIKKGKNT